MCPCKLISCKKCSTLVKDAKHRRHFTAGSWWHGVCGMSPYLPSILLQGYIFSKIFNLTLLKTLVLKKKLLPSLSLVMRLIRHRANKTLYLFFAVETHLETCRHPFVECVNKNPNIVRTRGNYGDCFPRHTSHCVFSS